MRTPSGVKSARKASSVRHTRAIAHFSRVLVCDASTLDALLRKVGLLQGRASHPLGCAR